MDAILVPVAWSTTDMTLAKHFIRHRLTQPAVKSKVLAAEKGLLILLLLDPPPIGRDAAFDEVDSAKARCRLKDGSGFGAADAARAVHENLLVARDILDDFVHGLDAVPERISVGSDSTIKIADIAIYDVFSGCSLQNRSAFPSYLS